MGAALYIVLEKDIPGLDTMIDGKALNRAEKKLAKTAKSLGVRPLMEFFSITPNDLEDFFDNTSSDILRPAEQWFSAEDGLTSVRALLKAVETSPDIMGAKNDLIDCERILSEAQNNGVRWHLAVDF